MDLCYVVWSNVIGEFDFGHLSLNLPHCVAPQTDIEPRYPLNPILHYSRSVRPQQPVHNCNT